MNSSPPLTLDDPSVRLNLANLENAPTMLKLARAFHKEDNHPLSEQGERALVHLLSDRTCGLVFKIEASRGVIGYAVLCFGYSVELGGRDAFLDDFYIIPPEQGRGLGRSVMDALIDIARKAGCAALHLEVMAGNRAHAFYRRTGFRDRGSTMLTLRL